MAASEEVADFVRHASRPFIFSASIPPANCATALAALRHLEQHPELPERLRELSLYARKGMTDRGMKIRESALTAPTPIIPIYTYETYHTLEVAREIYDRVVYVNPTLPPATPEGEALLRTSYMATHTEALLEAAKGCPPVCVLNRTGWPCGEPDGNFMVFFTPKEKEGSTLYDLPHRHRCLCGGRCDFLPPRNQLSEKGI